MTVIAEAELYAESLDKNIIKKIKYSRSLPEPENSRCGHQQPYNFFLVFDNFRTLPGNSRKPKSVDSKQKNLL